MKSRDEFVTVRNLYKSYGTADVIEGVSFNLLRGEVLGLLGSNGAGKTTILESIIGLRKVTKGEVVIKDVDVVKNPEKIRSFIGVQPQDVNLFSYLTVGETLQLFASLYKRPKSVQEILEQIELVDMEKKPARKLSGGQKKRLSIGIALISNPDVLFLDEPTTSLDPHSRRNIWEIINCFKKKGKSVLLTTHSMEEAYTQCDRVAILHKGKIAALDTPDNLVQEYSPKQTLFLKLKNNPDTGSLNDINEIMSFSTKALSTDYELEVNSRRVTKQLISSLMQAIDSDWQHIRIEQGTLEDVFIQVTGKGLQGGELVEQ